MGTVEKKDFDNYLKETLSWETEKLLDAARSRRLAWRVAAASMCIGVLGVASTTYTANRPPPPPFVLRVDKTTGIVDVVSSLGSSQENYEESVNKYFTQLYVRYREGFSSELAEEYYYNVGLMSIGVEQQKYFDAFNPKNPLSPLNVYGTYAKVKVQIKGTSFIKPNVALVRYVRFVERGSAKPDVSHWTATIAFKYSGAAMKEHDRAINPLGFQVTEYRVDPDAQMPDPSSPVSRTAEAAAPSVPRASIRPLAAMDTQPLQAPQVPPAHVVPAIEPQ